MVTEGNGIGDSEALNAAGSGNRFGTIAVIDPSPARLDTAAWPAPADAAPPACGGALLSAHRHSIGSPFLDYWRAHGGFAVLGYPLSEPFVEDGHPAQYTERFLLELIDGRVWMAPLGRLLTAGDRFGPVAPGGAISPVQPTPAAGQAVAGRFLAYWQAHGGMALLGAPIAAPTLERDGDGIGRGYLVQWCANARLEYHPEAARTPYAVELGLLGRQALVRRGWLRT